MGFISHIALMMNRRSRRCAQLLLRLAFVTVEIFDEYSQCVIEPVGEADVSDIVVGRKDSIFIGITGPCFMGDDEALVFRQWSGDSVGPCFACFQSVYNEALLFGTEQIFGEQAVH